MDSSSSSESEGSGGGGGGRALEWEILSAEDGNLSDSNNGADGEVHEQGVAVHSQHFLCPTEEASKDSEPQQQQEAEATPVRDWVEPSTSSQGGATATSSRDREEVVDKEDLDMLSSLVSSVLEGHMDGKNKATTQDDEFAASHASLQRELLSESGFSSLVPSDIHGNVVSADDEGAAAAAAASNPDDDDEEGLVRCLRRKTMVLGAYIRRASTLWSLTIAAALMGLVILGRQWQQERWQNQQLRLQLCYKDERISQLLLQVARLKQAVSGRRRISVVRASSTSASSK